DVEILATEYLEGGSPRPERVRIEAHLEACTTCTKLLHDFDRYRSLAARLRLGTMPSRMKTRILAAARRTHRPTPAPPSFASPASPVLPDRCSSRYPKRPRQAP